MLEHYSINKIIENEKGRQFILILVLFGITLVYNIFYFIYGDIYHILCRVPDDAAYFLRIAQNTAQGSGLTFDGINKTNGFQPLWLYTLVPFFMYFHGTPEIMMRMIMIFQSIILTMAGYFVFWVLKDIYSWQSYLLSAIVFIFITFFPSLIGMESGILILSLSLLFYYGWRYQVFYQQLTRQDIIFGFIIGMVILSRLDMVFLLFAIGLYFLLKIIKEPSQRKNNLNKFVVMTGSSIVLIIPYLIFNYKVFGSIMPISGQLKSNFPHFSFSLNALQEMSLRNIIFILLACIYLIWYLVHWRRKQNNSFMIQYVRLWLFLIAITTIIHFFHTLLFMDWAAFYWHYIVYSYFTSILIIEPLDKVFKRFNFAASNYLYWGVVLILMVIGSYKIYIRDHRSPNESWTVASYEAGIWTMNHTASTSIFAVKDAGNFSYFSQRRVINLDGVVNNKDYQEILSRKQLNYYLQKNHVGYVADFIICDSDSIINKTYDKLLLNIYSHLYDVYSDPIFVQATNEVYRSSLYHYRGKKRMFIIWEIFRR